MTPDGRITRLFVDEIEDETARVLFGEHAFSVPAALLPEGAREGDWVEVSVRSIPAPPGDTEARRERLAKDDPGGTIKL
jgi:Protein of unknown function (DUF3006)